MCGIAGYRFSGSELEPTTITKMVSALTHRGPDAQGYYESSPYCAGMRRLSINDLSTGNQPLFSEDGSVVLLYNGEIYNSPILRAELEAKGYRFKTSSDGEVICHLYKEYGVNLFERLDGMFAAALWIEDIKRLILARDIPGEKPLYYSKLSDVDLVFSSEIKSLIKFPELECKLNYQALWDYPTFLWIPEPQTVYQNVFALPRGHLLISDKDGITVRPYHNRFSSETVEFNDNSAIEITRQVVTEAINSRLLSDVPLGAFLSGGLDSSIVTAIAAKSHPELVTFTIGFEDLSDPYHGGADESQDAREFADSLGLENCLIRVTEDVFRQDLDTFCTYGDQPFGVSSGLGILSIARAARERGIKVLLSGDGADESFGGYSWYEHLNTVAKCSDEQTDNSDISFQNFGLDLETRLRTLNSYSPQKRAWAWHYYASENEKATLYDRECFENSQSSLRYFKEFKKDKKWVAEDFIKQDREFYFPLEMLRKVDRMTMAFSVEGRVPFAAPAVLAHADKLLYRHLVRNGTLKWTLREAFSDILPEGVRRRPKHGFNVPIDHWLSGSWSDLVDETFSMSSSLMKHGLIHKKSGELAKKMLSNPVRLNGHTVFCYIMLNIWLENIHGNNC